MDRKRQLTPNLLTHDNASAQLLLQVAGQHQHPQPHQTINRPTVRMQKPQAVQQRAEHKALQCVQSVGRVDSIGFPGVRGPLQPRQVEALFAQAVQQSLIRPRLHRRRARQNPQVFAARFAHGNQLVTRIEVDDPVVAPDHGQPRQPGGGEAHFQLGRIGGAVLARAAHGFGHLAVGLAAAVDNVELAVVAQPVQRTRVGHALALEAVGVFRDFVPGAQVAADVEPGDGLERLGWRGSLRRCGDWRQQGQREGQLPQRGR